MNTMGESDYGRGYREGFRAASGHYPGCPRLFAHTHGAAVCGECGATFRGPWRIDDARAALLGGENSAVAHMLGVDEDAVDRIADG